MSKKSSVSNGIGFGGLLTIAFIVLKLTHNIDWNWWWVLSPMWIPLAVIIGGAGIWFIFMIIIKIINSR